MRTKRPTIDKQNLLAELNCYNKLNNQLCDLNWLDKFFKKPYLTLMLIQSANRITRIVEPLVSELRQELAEKEWTKIMEQGGIIEVDNDTLIPKKKNS